MKSDFLSFFLRHPTQYKYGYYWASEYVNAWIFSDVSEAVETAKHYLRPTESKSNLDILISYTNSKSRFEHFYRTTIGKKLNAKSDIVFNSYSVDGIDVFSQIEPFDSDYLIIRNENHFSIVAHNSSEESFRSSVRIVREFILRCAQNSGALFTHASAVASSAGAVVIPGQSGAGKSTLMWTLCRLGDFSYISNDRCLLKREPSGSLSVSGWPISLRIGRGLAEHKSSKFPLGSFVRKENASAIARQRLDQSPLWGEKVKYEITPLEFEKITNQKISSSSSVKVVIIPKLDLSEVPVRLNPQSFDQVVRTIKETITEPVDADYLGGWLGIKTISNSRVIELLDEAVEIFRTIPCFEVTGDARNLASDARELCSEIAKSYDK